MAKPTQGEILKIVDRLVREGKLEHVIIDGKPGVRLVAPPNANITSKPAKAGE